MEKSKTPPIFLPKLLSTLRSYSWPQLWGDLTAGVIVGVVALPLAIAFAIASGVTPDRGLTTAIIAGFLISVLGGSRVQIGGPTGAFVVIIYGIVERYGVDGLLMCGLMAGVLLILMGLLRLGSVIKFIPYQLTVGFTSGIAVIIFFSQLKDFLGLKMGPVPADFTLKWQAYWENLHSIDPMTIVLSCVSLAILIGWPRINKKIPGSIVAILLVTGLVHVFHVPVETIGSRFGALPSGLPHPAWPHIAWVHWKAMVGPAFTVAILGAIESLLSATVADGMIEGRHRSNTELIGQGIANLVVPLFGGIPATGAIARTATNVKNGGRTPVAGIIHSLTLFGVVLVFGRWAGMIPMCVLAAILIVVSYHMSEWHAFMGLLRAPRMDVAVLLVTFFLTVLVDLTTAVEVGLMLALVLFMKRMTDVTTVKQLQLDMNETLDEAALRSDTEALSRRKVPHGVAVYEAEGAFFFGVAELLRDTFDLGRKPPRVLILRMRHVLALDVSGLRALKDLKSQCHRHKATLLLSGIHAQPLDAMVRSDFYDAMGAENVHGSLDESLARAAEILAQK